MTRVLLALLLGMVGLAGQAPARTVAPTAVVARSVDIVGVIGDGAMLAAERVAKLSATPGDIYLLINSPGGQVLAGRVLISALELAHARGRRFVCYVPVIAASMAFQVLAHCDERYVLRGAFLLWHPVQAFVIQSMTPAAAAKLAADLAREERLLLDDLKSRVTGIDPDVFMHHYTLESLLTAPEVADMTDGFITLVDDIPGLTRFLPFSGSALGDGGADEALPGITIVFQADLPELTGSVRGRP